MSAPDPNTNPEVWIGPVASDALRAFGPGTTAGGRAEAGWFCVGTMDDPDSLEVIPDP